MNVRKIIKCKHKGFYWSLEYRWSDKDHKLLEARVAFMDAEKQIIKTNINYEEYADKEARKKNSIPGCVETEKYGCCFDCGMHHIDSSYIPEYADKL